MDNLPLLHSNMLSKHKDHFKLMRDMFNSDFESLFNNFETMGSDFSKFSGMESSEDQNNYYYSIDMPGVIKSDIDLSIDNGTVNISYVRKTKTSSSSYNNKFNVQKDADLEKIDNKLENGVLNIVIPKKIVLPLKKESQKITIK